MESDTLLKKTLRNVKWIMTIQAVITIVSTALNILLARFVKKNIYGFISINASLVVTFTNNLLKSGFRMALQKNMFGSAPQRDRAKSLFDNPTLYFKSLQRSVMNAIWLGIAITFCIAPLFCMLFIEYYEYNGTTQKDFKQTLMLYSVGCVIQALAEPFIGKYMSEADLTTRAVSEGLSVLVKDTVLYVLILGFDFEILAFGYGEVAYAISCLTLSVVCAVVKEREQPKGFDLATFLPGKVELPDKSSFWIYDDHKVTLREVSIISVIQGVFGECEKMLLIVFNTLTPDEMSEYSLVYNLSGIIPRVIYAPMEESTYSYFGNCEVGGSSPTTPAKLTFTEDLQMMCHVVSLLSAVGLFTVVYSFNYSYAVLHTLYSSVWSNPSTTALMHRYSYCLVAFALNGVTEGYVRARATPKELRIVQVFAIINTVVTVLLISSLIRFGATGLIIATCANMVYRIVVSSCLIMSIKKCGYALHNFISLWTNALPRQSVLVSYMVCFIVCLMSSWWIQPRSLIMHLGVGILVAGGNAAYLWKNYGEIYRKVKSGHSSAAQTKIDQ